MNGLEQLVVSNIATITTSAGFIWYLSKRDKLMRDRDKEFSMVVKNHLHESTKAIKDNAEVQKQLAVELQKLSSIIIKYNQ